MYIAKSKDWSENHTPLSKYFIEKVKQEVDFEETISNRHRTTNGYVIISEIIYVSNLALKSDKFIYRLINLLQEAVDEDINSNVTNDFILDKYHSDIIAFYKEVNFKRLQNDDKYVLHIHNKSKIHLKRLEKNYFSSIKNEFNSLDFKSEENFRRKSDLIDKIVQCLIPYLLHIGYSTTSISDITYRLSTKENALYKVNKVLSHFLDGKTNYSFLIKLEEDHKGIDSITKFLNTNEIDFEEVNVEDVQDNLGRIKLDIQDNETLYEITHGTHDPHNFIRVLYDKAIRYFVSSKDRIL